MPLIIKFIVLVFCVALFYIRPENKLKVVLFSVICLNAVTVIAGPLGQSFKILSCCLIFSEITKLKKRFPFELIFLMFISLFAVVILQQNSPLYGGVSGLLKLFIYEFVCGELILLFGWLTLKNIKILPSYYTMIYYAMIFITFIGILNIILGYSPWLAMLDIPFNFLDFDRFRMQSTFIYPFDYGFICIAVLFFSYYGYRNSYLKKNKWRIILMCSLFGIIFCGCRTVLLCAVFGAFILILTLNKPGRFIKYLLFSVIILLMGYCFIPAVHEYVDFMLTAFDPNSEMSGSSSMSMREEQTLSVLSYIISNPLFGRGYGFFYHDLNWAEGFDGSADLSLKGLEGVHLSYLLERGFVGYGLYLLFYIILLWVLWRKRNKGKLESSVGITIILCYLSFGHMTGELNSLFPTLIIVGILLKIIDIKNNEIISDNNTRI